MHNFRIAKITEKDVSMFASEKQCLGVVDWLSERCYMVTKAFRAFLLLVKVKRAHSQVWYSLDSAQSPSFKLSLGLFFPLFNHLPGGNHSSALANTANYCLQVEQGCLCIVFNEWITHTILCFAISITHVFFRLSIKVDPSIY